MSKSGSQAMRPALLCLLVSWSGLCASPALAQVWPVSRGDVPEPGDAAVWAEWRQPSRPVAVDAPLADEAFSVVARGGPWSEQAWRPLTRDQAELMAKARAGRWGDVLAEVSATDAWPDARDRDGATLLTLAARQGHLEAVRELLRRGADPDRAGLAGLTPLGAAALGGHDLVTQALLRAGADVGRWSASGQAPLHLAARGGHVHVMRILMAANADPLAWNREGLGAMHEAAAAGNIDTMSALVAAGVPASVGDRHGLNALHAAALGRHHAAVDWLRERGVSAPQVLTQVLIDQLALPAPVQP